MQYISIVVTISRPENIDLVIENIKKTLAENKDGLFEIILAVDNFKIKNVLEKVQAQIANKSQIKNITEFNTGNKPPLKFDMARRRNRIAKLRNQSKEYIGGSLFVFSFEDDTILPALALYHLWNVYGILPNPGFVQGVQVGRWGKPYLGVWNVDDVHNPQEYTTATHNFAEVTVDPCDAGGFYCYLTPTKLYKTVTYSWREPCGPDVDYGLQLRSLGFENYTDYFVECGHRTDKKDIWPTDDVNQIQFKWDGKRWTNKIIKKIDIAI
jgi:hypothetical protein